MKKIIISLSLLALIGAGCAKAPAPQAQTPQSDTSAINLNQTTPQATNEKNSPTTQIKTEPVRPMTTSANIITTDDVPVMDIFLGEPTKKMTMEVGDAFFKPNIIEAKPGDSIQITFSKVTGTHVFNIDETDSHYKITQGTNITVIAPQKPGSYKFYCSIGDHRAKGMEGTLIVK